MTRENQPLLEVSDMVTISTAGKNPITDIVMPVWQEQVFAAAKAADLLKQTRHRIQEAQMMPHVFSLYEEDQTYVDFVNYQLETATWQDRCDPEYEPLWPEEASDIPASSAFEFN